MASAKSPFAISVVALAVIAPLCLAIRQVTAALQMIGFPAPVAAELSLALLGLLLALSLAGILSGYRHHHRRWPVLVGLASSAAILFFVITRSSMLAGYLSCGGLITAGAGNIILRRRRVTHGPPIRTAAPEG